MSYGSVLPTRSTRKSGHDVIASTVSEPAPDDTMNCVGPTSTPTGDEPKSLLSGLTITPCAVDDSCSGSVHAPVAAPAAASATAISTRARIDIGPRIAQDGGRLSLQSPLGFPIQVPAHR